MNKFYISFFLVLSLLLSYSSIIKAQQDNLEIIPPIFDNVQFRVFYQFSQQAEKRKEPITLTDTMALNIGQNWSVYYDWHKTKLDSISKLISTQFDVLFMKQNDEELQERLESGEKEYNAYQRTPETALIYKERATGKVITIDDGPYETGIGPTYLQLNEEISGIGWKISSDTATVLNYICRKAMATFRGRNYIVWFTTDIPVNEGPWKLHGLPGLILKAETTESLFSFTAIGLESVENIQIKYPDDRKINPSKNLKQLYDFRRNQRRKTDIILVKNNIATAYITMNPVSLYSLEIMEE